MSAIQADGKPSNSVHWLDVVRDVVKSLRFGVVQITVHESKVVQIETTEKIRLPSDPKAVRPEQTTAGRKRSTEHARPVPPEGS